MEGLTEYGVEVVKSDSVTWLAAVLQDYRWACGQDGGGLELRYDPDKDETVEILTVDGIETERRRYKGRSLEAVRAMASFFTMCTGEKEKARIVMRHDPEDKNTSITYYRAKGTPIPEEFRGG